MARSATTLAMKIAKTGINHVTVLMHITVRLNMNCSMYTPEYITVNYSESNRQCFTKGLTNTSYTRLFLNKHIAETFDMHENIETVDD